jgi:hypothetical protein
MWLAAVRGLHSPACGAFCCLGHHVVNVVHPRDPIVRIGEAGANPQSRRPAGARISARQAPASSAVSNLATTDPSRRSSSRSRSMPAYPALMPPSLGCRPVAVPCANWPLAAMTVVRRFAVAGLEAAARSSTPRWRGSR